MLLLNDLEIDMQRPAMTESSSKNTKLAYQLAFLRIWGRENFNLLLKLLVLEFTSLQYFC